MEQEQIAKKQLPLSWLVGGIIGLIVYIGLFWWGVFKVYETNGFWIAFGALLGMYFVMKRYITPGLLNCLRSKKV